MDNKIFIKTELDFNDFINLEFGSIFIFGKTFRASEILKEMDPDTYSFMFERNKGTVQG